MNARIKLVDPAAATGKARELLGAVEAKMGMTPNITRAMASSPAVLEAYLSFSGALSRSRLGARAGEQIAIAVGTANRCDYCVAAHTAGGAKIGVSDTELSLSRGAASDDPRIDAILKFARTIVQKRGDVGDDDLNRIRQAGLDDGQIAEVVAHVGLNIFTNYFNKVAGTPIDFPNPNAAAAA